MQPNTGGPTEGETVGAPAFFIAARKSGG